MKTNVEELPFSSETEISLIGALLANNELIERINFLREEHFYSPLGKIYGAILRIIEDQRPATPFTLGDAFDDDFKDVGGTMKYMAACMTKAAMNVANPVSLARYIKEMYDRRSLINVCEKSLERFRDVSIKLSDETSKIIEICEKVTSEGDRFKFISGEQVSENIIKNIDNDSDCYSTGIRLLDKAMFGGLYSSKLYGFAGRKKHGKTILLGTISCNLACNGFKHLFIAGEMSPDEIHQRNLSRMGEFNTTCFRNSFARKDDFQQRLKKAVEWQQNNIIYRHAPALTFDGLKQIIKVAVINFGIKGFILDYWQLVGGKDAKTNKAEHLDDVAQWCADICKQKNIFGIVAAQINREDGLRGSDGLNNACDQLYQIQRPDITTGEMWLQMKETRYTEFMDIGSKDDCRLHLNPKGTFFEETI